MECYSLFEPIKIYPNPTFDKLTINFGSYPLSSREWILIYNIIGQKVLDELVVDSIVTINLDNKLASGHYKMAFVDKSYKVVAVRSIVLY
ncbi:MAG: hypothetical protein ACI8ZN_000188 [Bacteroidia bacterium]